MGYHPKRYISDYSVSRSGTTVGHILNVMNIPLNQIAEYPDIWLIWLFGYLAVRDKYGQVGYPLKEHDKCNSEALT